MPIYKITGEKKDGFQKYRVVVNYTDPSGKKKTAERKVYGKAAAEQAEEELRKKVREGSTGQDLRSKPMTVEELWTLYEEEKKTEIRASTMAKKKSIIATHVLPAIGKMPLRSLAKEDILNWRTTMSKKDLSVTMKNNAYKELRALLNFAVDRGLIRDNPLKRIPTFRDPYQKSVPEKLRYYTKDQYAKYIAEAEKEAAERNDLRAWGILVFFEIAYLTGMRKGEIHALRWTDLEDDAYIWVRRSITQKLKGQKWVETPPKTPSSVRRLQLPKSLKDDLEEHKKRQMSVKGWKSSFFIVGGPDPIPDTSIENANARFAEAAGLPHITIHEFRHSHASLLCNAGINIKEIARRLGHADVEMTLRTYSHLYPKEEERAVSILDTL